MITIYGDTNSGNCLKVKFLCDHLGLDYDWAPVDLAKGETRTPAFLRINPAGQIPAVIFADGTTLAQSNAILLHLAHVTALVPHHDPPRLAKVHEWLFWEQYSHEPNIAVVRFQRVYRGLDQSEVDQDRFKAGNRALDLMDDHLAEKKWFVGDAMTIADIALFPYTRFAPQGGFDLAPRKNVGHWLDRVGQELGVAALESARL
jgi:glutathione S-transferase